jgi:hypothetical protein
VGRFGRDDERASVKDAMLDGGGVDDFCPRGRLRDDAAGGVELFVGNDDHDDAQRTSGASSGRCL